MATLRILTVRGVPKNSSPDMIWEAARICNMRPLGFWFAGRKGSQEEKRPKGLLWSYNSPRKKSSIVLLSTPCAHWKNCLFYKGIILLKNAVLPIKSAVLLNNAIFPIKQNTFLIGKWKMCSRAAVASHVPTAPIFPMLPFLESQSFLVLEELFWIPIPYKRP